MSVKRKICWVFDLDDTLIWTSYAYSVAFEVFYNYLLKLYKHRLLEIRTLGTISEKIDLGLREEINPALMIPYGYTRHRFPESLVRTYRWLCAQGFGNVNELVLQRVRDIGYSAFDPLRYQEQGLVEGGGEVLDFLVARGDALILITKGDELVQKTKIDMLNLDRWFGAEIHITHSKTEQEFRALQERYPDHTLISVGNSFQSDIVPALQAGAYGLYIPYYTWAAELIEEHITDPRVVTIDRIFRMFSFVETNPLFNGT
ncbi:MAG: hypothetical protein KGI50_03475 [Patescibacteria group bacterium]|nr:hypothetical protein [Patescibacteria group bacterium]MDE2438352.1 hypothetical protein [Patescibacteria group bacterium]